MRINWPYVAGLFDGEGSVVASGNGFKISIGLSAENGLCLLQMIRTFLSSQGIEARIHESRVHAQRGWQQHHALTVKRMHHVLKCLESLLPLVEIKRTVVQDHIRWIRLYGLPLFNKRA